MTSLPFNKQQECHGKGIESLLAKSINKDDVHQTLQQWRIDKSNTFPIIELFIKRFNNLSQKSKATLLAASKMADEPNKNAYHGNAHFLDVTAGTIMLGAKAYDSKNITIDQYALIVTIALIHDYKHDGQGNQGQQFKLEQHAFDNAKENLRNAGASKKDLAITEAIILSTDVSKDFNDPKAQSPADTLKAYLKNDNLNSNILHPRLRILHDTQMGDAAQMLQDADIGTAMCNPRYNDLQGLLIARETGAVPNNAENYDRNQQIDFFIPKIMHEGTLFSTAGKEIIEPWIPAVIEYYKQKLNIPKIKQNKMPIS